MSVINVIKSSFLLFFKLLTSINNSLSSTNNSMVEFVIIFPKGIKFFLHDLEIRFTRNSIQICD